MTQSKKILLFDDNYESLLPLKLFLEDICGHIVDLTAEKSVLNNVQATCYDLVIVDRMIARNSLDKDGKVCDNLYFDGVHWEDTGAEFLRRLRKGEFDTTDGNGTPSHVPAIVLSAVGDNNAKADKGVLGKTRLIDKPFDLDEFIEVLDTLLEETN